MNNLNEITEKAIEKIKKETEEFKGDKYGKVIYKEVSKQLINFCEQESDFAEVVLKTKRTLSDCCIECVKGVTTGISDRETYERAVRFYYPDSKVRMLITLEPGKAPDDEYMSKEAKKLTTAENAVKKSGEKKNDKTNINTDTKSKKLSEAKERRNKAITEKRKTEGQIMIFDLI